MTGAVLRTAWVETRLGRFLVGATECGLALLSLDELRAAEQLAWWNKRHPSEGVSETKPTGLLARAAEELRAYADGDRVVFDVPLDLRGTDFQRAVWAAERAIPFGQTRTYAQIANTIGRPRAVRAVGQATGANPVPIVVPCHRVLAKDGLGGFTGGLDHKRRLLRHEGALLFA